MGNKALRRIKMLVERRSCECGCSCSDSTGSFERLEQMPTGSAQRRKGPYHGQLVTLPCGKQVQQWQLWSQAHMPEDQGIASDS